MDFHFANLTGVKGIAIERSVDVIAHRPGHQGACDDEDGNDRQQHDDDSPPNAVAFWSLPRSLGMLNPVRLGTSALSPASLGGEFDLISAPSICHATHALTYGHEGRRQMGV